MIGMVTTPLKKEELVPVLAVTRAQVQAQGQVPEASQPPSEDREPQPRKSTPLDYPDLELELSRIKALQEWVDEERIHFESKRARRRTCSGSEGGSLAEPAQSIRQEEVEILTNQPFQLQDSTKV